MNELIENTDSGIDKLIISISKIDLLSRIGCVPHLW